MVITIGIHPYILIRLCSRSTAVPGITPDTHRSLRVIVNEEFAAAKKLIVDQ
jgi:hypothetical protein